MRGAHHAPPPRMEASGVEPDGLPAAFDRGNETDDRWVERRWGPLLYRLSYRTTSGPGWTRTSDLQVKGATPGIRPRVWWRPTRSRGGLTGSNRPPAARAARGLTKEPLRSFGRCVWWSYLVVGGSRRVVEQTLRFLVNSQSWSLPVIRLVGGGPTRSARSQARVRTLGLHAGGRGLRTEGTSIRIRSVDGAPGEGGRGRLPGARPARPARGRAGAGIEEPVPASGRVGSRLRARLRPRPARWTPGPAGPAASSSGRPTGSRRASGRGPGAPRRRPRSGRRRGRRSRRRS